MAARNEVIGLHPWFGTPAGRYLTAWEQSRVDRAVGDLFGYHGVQLGLPWFDGLRANRMPHRWLVGGPDDLEPQAGTLAGAPDMLLPPRFRPAIHADFGALPFDSRSLDLVLMPHTLELTADPHAALREVERTLVPEGRVVIAGLNPVSFWGLKQRRARVAQRLGLGQRYLPDAVNFIGYWRLRDWLRLLSFEVESVHFGCWRPALRSQRWLDRTAWMDPLGGRWWPIFGAAYFVVAVKRVPGMRRMEKPRKLPAVRAVAPAASVAGRSLPDNPPS